MLPEPFDAIDLKILEELQQDAKLSNVELAARVALSPSPCLVRVRALEQAGVIDKYVTLVNPLKVGLGVSVFIQISLERQVEAALEKFQRAMQEFNEVMECYLMTGDADYLLRVVVSDVQELENFIVNKLSRIEGVSSIRSSFALKQVKYKTAVPITAGGREAGTAKRARR
jgi:Lrp/AsnC family leucine-responsive transcriptional regulator